MALIDASMPGAFTSWLGEHGFVVRDVDIPVLEAYAAEGSWFVAVRVSEMTPVVGSQMLDPLGITYDDGGQPAIPARIGWNPTAPSATMDVWTIGPSAVVLPGVDVDFAAPPDRSSATVQALASLGDVLSHFALEIDEEPPLVLELDMMPWSWRVQDTVEVVETWLIPMPCEGSGGTSGGSPGSGGSSPSGSGWDGKSSSNGPPHRARAAPLRERLRPMAYRSSSCSASFSLSCSSAAGPARICARVLTHPPHPGSHHRPRLAGGDPR